mmetsp:Transcript_5148/g.11205  ORF Transcript_5148/g.11205 Transcript_5148/m.11205 type:complete len:291 (-) Transcript_5148:1067-1939(-)
MRYTWYANLLFDGFSHARSEHGSKVLASPRKDGTMSVDRLILHHECNVGIFIVINHISHILNEGLSDRYRVGPIRASKVARFVIGFYQRSGMFIVRCHMYNLVILQLVNHLRRRDFLARPMTKLAMITITPSVYSTLGRKRDRVRPTTCDLRHKNPLKSLNNSGFDFVNLVTVSKLTMFSTAESVHFTILRNDSGVEAATCNLNWPLTQQRLDETGAVTVTLCAMSKTAKLAFSPTVDFTRIRQAASMEATRRQLNDSLPGHSLEKLGSVLMSFGITMTSHTIFFVTPSI